MAEVDLDKYATDTNEALLQWHNTVELEAHINNLSEKLLVKKEVLDILTEVVGALEDVPTSLQMVVDKYNKEYTTLLAEYRNCVEKSKKIYRWRTI